ncbi:hypothetical protein [Herpetosiphon giganteus]|uniref:hypothetical protein n=1 Tax=Herpetosiphon giganteus TaxID=2029754 RepID=UPI001959B17F|nr:hypothetical protein [Herpetosiphon giganteus]MBM7843508.1 hypothetical protein [Herpetosiphon giganteus]
MATILQIPSLRDQQSREVKRLLMKHLRSFSDTLEVNDVAHVPLYQQLAVNIVWKVRIPPCSKRNIRIAFYYDEYGNDQQLFIPTWQADPDPASRLQITAAEYWYSYVVATSKVYVLPVAQLRPWFNQHSQYLPAHEVKHQLPDQPASIQAVGRFVPTQRLLRELDELEIWPLNRLQPSKRVA